MSETIKIAGIDGCPGGRWAIVTASTDTVNGPAVDLQPSVVEDLGPLLTALRHGELSAIAIDMPIGLLSDRSRLSDREARALLGPRRASVFPTPVRAVLDAVDYREACALSREASGKALSRQAFHLVERIRYLDGLIATSDQDRLVEAHPELAFTRLNQSFVETTKHTAEGRAERKALLQTELDDGEVTRVIESGLAPAADLLDAMSLVTTSRRLVQGAAIELGAETDPTGKRASVWY